MPSCQTCGAPLPDGARFCPACGTPLVTASAIGTRRPVTIVFTDVVGSTALAERLDAETLGAVMTRYYEAMREVVERYGGAVEKFIGDAVVATFGTPQVHEDDALRAVRAAHEMHAALARLNDELERRWGTRLEVRTGVATGEVLTGAASAVLGSPANLAARLQTEAGDGEILLSASTHRIVRDHVRSEPAGSLELKGFDEPVTCFRLVGVDGAGRPRTRRPHVGREQELALIEVAYARAVRDRRAQLATVLGEPGAGKTRLVEEAVVRLPGDPLVLRGRCLPYGEAITFFPVGEAISAAAGIERDDDAGTAQAKVAALVPPEATAVAARAAEAIGLGGPAGAPEETLWAIRRFFELLALERPLVLVFDDLQWAEPTFLDLVHQLADRGRGVAELVVAVARPELVEQRPDWAGGAANAVTISLEPLTPEEGAALVRNVAAGAELDPAAAARLAAAAGGNPLFLEEYVAMLVDDGVITKHDGHWLVPTDVSAGASTPPTLTGLLTARLHRLPPDERDALVRASVIGKAFSADELAVLLDDGARAAELLAGVLERDMVVPGGAVDGAYEFRHQLLRDAAYASLPKARRAELHERFADHLETAFPERPEELDELAGYHLAQAHDHRAELGASDQQTSALADRAASRLSAAGGRAVERGDPRAATRALGRAASLATEPAARAAIRLRLCHALGDAADADGWEAALSAGLADAADAGDDRLLTRFEHLRTTSALLRDPGAVPPADVVAHLRAQAATLEAHGDGEGVAECHYQLATVAWIQGDASGFERWARRAREDAAACGNARLIGRATSYVIVGLLRGPTPLPQALAELGRLRDGTALSAAAAASVQLGEAEMLAYLGRTTEAHALVDAATATFDELGAEVDLAVAGSVRAIVADTNDDLEGAEGALRTSYERFRAMDDAANGGLMAVDLADVLARLGRQEEAEQMAATAAGLAADFDAEAQVRWRIAAARARAALGDEPAALDLLREAEEHLATSDFTMLRADSMLAMADVAAALGRRAEAVERLETARASYLAKGHVVGERRALDRLEAASAAQPS